ncbi:MAG: hypothetical protein R2690_10735 [Acidimicrobiales bacterium]
MRSASAPGTGEAQTTTSDDAAAERRTAEVIITADPRVEDDLGAVALDGTEYRAAVDAYGVTEARLTEAEATIETSIADLRALLAARERLEGELVGAQRRRLKDEIRLAVVRADLRTWRSASTSRAGSAARSRRSSTCRRRTSGAANGSSSMPCSRIASASCAS